MLSDEELKARILWKLRRRGNIGGSHTSIDNLAKSFGLRDLGKKGNKRLLELAKELIKEGLIIPKPTHYGLEISLSSALMKETEDRIKKAGLPLD